MARMSIDDMIGRDTRVDRLARLCGWSRRETRACLLDVWALCYDRVVPYLPADDIEVTAARDAIAPPAYPEGFVAALRAVGLARDATPADRTFTRKDGTKVPWPDQQWRDRVYLAGASERVGYLVTKKTAGHEGGVKSGQSRRSKRKQSFAPASTEAEARGNPPDPVPDPAPVPDQKEIPSPARAIPPTTAPTPKPATVQTPAAPPIATSSWQRHKAWWDALLEAFDRLRRPTPQRPAIKPNTPDLAKHPNEQMLVACERFLRAGGYDDAGVDAKMRHVVLVAEAESERLQHLDYFKPAIIFDVTKADRFPRAVDTTVEEARRGRATTPRAPAHSAGPQSIRVVRDDDAPPPIPAAFRSKS